MCVWGGGRAPALTDVMCTHLTVAVAYVCNACCAVKEVETWSIDSHTSSPHSLPFCHALIYSRSKAGPYTLDCTC